MTDISRLAIWAEGAFGHAPQDLALYARALTHGSHGPDNYERLEFLGDRVLGLLVAEWLYERFPDEPEGRLSARYNMLVSRETCAEIGRAIGVPRELILGKQARDDGAQESDNVVGDAVEALIAALFLDHGIAAPRDFVRAAWAEKLGEVATAPKHPKSALQEYAAAHHCGAPVYTTDRRHGPHHAPRFNVSVEVRGRAGGSAVAEGSSKQEAETAAAAALLAKLAQ